MAVVRVNTVPLFEDKTCQSAVANSHMCFCTSPQLMSITRQGSHSIRGTFVGRSQVYEMTHWQNTSELKDTELRHGQTQC